MSENPRGKKKKKEMSTWKGFIRRIEKRMTPNFIGWIFATDTIICIGSLAIKGYSFFPTLVAALTFLLALIYWNRSDYEKGNF